MACADVTSANVVGYQNKEAPTGGWHLMCNTFVGVGKEKSAMTLGDFIPNANWNFMTGDCVLFLKPSGATETFTYKGVEYEATFTYVPDPFAGMMQVKPGWYQSVQVVGMNPIPADDWPIEWGDGFVVEAHAANTTLNFSGEVLKGAQNLQPITGGWNVMGNALPVPTTLSELAANANWNFMTGDCVLFLKPSGATETFTYKDVEYEATFTYVPDPFAGMMQVTPGWYQSVQVVGMNPIPANDWPLAEGEAFVVEVHTPGTELQLPAAITE